MFVSLDVGLMTHMDKNCPEHVCCSREQLKEAWIIQIVCAKTIDYLWNSMVEFDDFIRAICINFVSLTNAASKIFCGNSQSNHN